MTCEELRRIMAHRGPDQYRALEVQICGGAADVPTAGPRRPAAAPSTPSVGHGVGDAMTRLIAEMGKTAKECFTCKLNARKMNEWGIEGCKQRREEIAGMLAAAAKRSWGESFWIGTKMARQPWFRVGQPFLSVVDEAIRRAESQA